MTPRENQLEQWDSSETPNDYQDEAYISNSNTLMKDDNKSEREPCMRQMRDLGTNSILYNGP